MRLTGAILEGKVMRESSAHKYQPPPLEKAVLAYLQAEYSNAQALCSHIHDSYHVIRRMAVGRYLRDPASSSQHAKVYFPYLAIHHQKLQDIVLSRMVPNPQRMDFVEMMLKSSLDEQALQQAQLDPQEVSAALTVEFRRLLNQSNLYEALNTGLIYGTRYGFAVGFPDIKTKMVCFPADEIFDPNDPEVTKIEEDENGFPELVWNHPDIFMKTDPETGEERAYIDIPIRDRLEFTVLDPANVFVGDLENSGGIETLPWLTVYQRRSYREILDNRMIKRSGVPIAGRYLNTEFLHFGDAQDLPSTDDSATTETMDYDERYRAKVRANYTFKVPIRMGRFFFEHIPEVANGNITGQEIEAFRRKWGLTKDDLHEPRVFLIEWSEKPGVLLRFEPWTWPVRPNTQGIVTEFRHWTFDGHTFGRGDYAMGGGDAEVEANNMMEAAMTQGEESAFPMKWVNEALIVRNQQEVMGGMYGYRPNRIFYTTQSTSPFGDIRPDPNGYQAAVTAHQRALETIRMITGVTAQMLGFADSADSATEAANQRNYMEQALLGTQFRFEWHFLRPLLEHAFLMWMESIKREEKLKGPGFSIMVQSDQLDIFGDKYRDAVSLEMVLTSKLIDGVWDFEILTTSGGTSKSEQIQRLERFVGALTNLHPILTQAGIMPNWQFIIMDLAKKLDLSPSQVLQNLPPQMAAMMQMQQQEGNPGGAGGERPDYQRNAPEVPAPGEGMEGVALDESGLTAMMEGGAVGGMMNVIT